MFAIARTTDVSSGQVFRHVEPRHGAPQLAPRRRNVLVNAYVISTLYVTPWPVCFIDQPSIRFRPLIFISRFKLIYNTENYRSPSSVLMFIDRATIFVIKKRYFIGTCRKKIIGDENTIQGL